MRFYYYTDGAYNVYLDDWGSMRYLSMRTNEVSDMPANMRHSNPRVYYGKESKNVPDLYVILITGKDYI